MGIFSSIIVGGIVGIVYAYGIRSLIKENDPYKIEDKVLNRILSLGQLHILYAFLIYGYANTIDPMLIDAPINDLLNETFIGDIVGFFTDVDTEPNYLAIAMTEKIKESAILFLIIVLGIAGVEGLGLIERKMDRWTIECCSLLCTICSYLFLVKVINFQMDIFANSKLASIANWANVSLLSSVSWIGTVMKLCIVGLIITHFLYHRGLNKYYNVEGTLNPAKEKIIKLVVASAIVLWGFDKFMLNPDVFVDNLSISEVQENVVKEPIQKEIYKEEKQPDRLESLINNPNVELIIVNDGFAYYLQEHTESNNKFYIQNLKTGAVRERTLEETNANNELEAWIYSVREGFKGENNNEILFIGDNGALSMGNGYNVLKYNISSDRLTFVCFGREVKKVDNYLMVSQLELINEGDCIANNEYYTYMEHYDFDGNKIDGRSIKGKGFVGKYPIEMSMYCLNGKITGWYRYKNHTNYMTIEGIMHTDDTFEFIEYDEKGKAVATFKGEADFRKQLMQGEFNHPKRKLSFVVRGGESADNM